MSAEDWIGIAALAAGLFAVQIGIAMCQALWRWHTARRTRQKR